MRIVTQLERSVRHTGHRLLAPFLGRPYMGLRAHLRWMMGKGYDRATFERVYQHKHQDAWGYDGQEFARRRFHLLIELLPVTPIATALEVGCAEGHFTRLLAGRVTRVLACDISEQAIARARENCRDLSNVRFAVRDIRNGLPDEPLDLILYSDVIYYLSRTEATELLKESARVLQPGSFLLYSNEWHPSYSALLPPREVLPLIESSGNWTRLRLDEHNIDADRVLTAGLFQRR